MTLRIEKAIAAKWDDEDSVLWWNNEWWPYKRLATLADGYEQVLREASFGAGQRLVTLLPNCPALLGLSIACWRIGSTIVPLNIQAGKESLISAIGHADPSVVVTIEEVSQKVGPLLEISHIVTTTVDLQGKLAPFQALSKELSHEDIALLFYTSGTTGKPKAVPLTHENVISDMDQALRLVDIITDDEVFLNVLPNFHTLGFVVSGMLPLLSGFRQVVMANFMPPEKVLDVIESTGVSVIVAVPTMLHFMVAAAIKGNRSFSSVRVVISGGDRFPEKLDKRVQKVFGVPVLEGYGLTECSPVLAVNKNYSHRKLGTVGFVFPDIKFKIKNIDGEDLPDNHEGILWVKGPSIARGYFKDSLNTSEKFIDGWFNTGDIVQIDEEGYVRIMDRASDMIIVGGFNVYPQEVEDILTSHPAVAEAAAVGRSNSLTGEVVHAYVITRPGMEVDSHELVSFCKENLAHYKVPRKVDFVEELPRNSLGKVLRRALRK